MTEQTIRPWGKYTVVGKTKIIEVNPNSKLSLQYHKLRDESWQIISGTGIVIIGDKEYDAKPGDKFFISKGKIHRVITKEDTLIFLEIATGDVDEDDIVRIEDEYKRNREIIVAISGYFDPLHVGHLEYIKLAKQLGDKLIVILNNDFQAEIKKDRPFMKVQERKKVLESLKYIDEVFISIDNDRTVCKSLEVIKPNIFANGGDRFRYEIPESEICRKLNIKIVDGLGEKIQSSSDLIKNSLK